MNILITNIRQLLQVEEQPAKWVAGKAMAELQLIEHAWLLLKEGYIEDFGSMRTLDQGAMFDALSDLFIMDVSGKLVMPSFCDSHSHLVYAGSREMEFVDRIRGLSYEEIAKKGGGILNSAKLLQNTTEEKLYEQSLRRLHEVVKQHGTGAVEIKSGYGLDLENELKILRVIEQLKNQCIVEIKATFLGAHAIPEAYKNDPDKYVDIIVREMIPAVAKENLAEFIDVFCDRGFYTPRQTERILEAGIKHGLRPKIHANELDYSGGIQTGVKYNALSVDHLEFAGDDEIKALLDSNTMPTILPGTSFFLGLDYAPARRIIDAGLPVALASDFNPGSSPSGNMKFIMSLGCIMQKMLPEEVIHATTLNGAYAMGLEKTHGSICRGKEANVIITKEIPNYAYLPYAYGTNLIETVIFKGSFI
ncbi:MAG: imidazolonepropionase [Bacteroidales bacterium]|nr:imidazolonepropionase [Bacteroidales bacterium]